jgi:DhnA family fructose-bisphosphate aldolase class Ia
MTRIDPDDRGGAAALELLGRVLEDARSSSLEALIEPVMWRGGRMSRATDDIVLAAVIAHDLGAPLLKVPVPDVPAGQARIEAVARVVASVGVPVLFLGGPHDRGGRDRVVDETRDVMDGGGAGLAMGRAIFQESSPAGMAKELAEVVHGR